jgi:hypothetical protein
MTIIHAISGKMLAHNPIEALKRHRGVSIIHSATAKRRNISASPCFVHGSNHGAASAGVPEHHRRPW